MTVQATESSAKRGGILSKIIGPGRTMWTLAIVLAFVAAYGALTLLGDAAATQTYYVIKQSVPARTQITSDMLIPREAKVNQAPPQAYDLAYVRDHDVFSQIALRAGDVLSPSNAGPLGRITDNVPSNFVAASFSAAPDIAVAGKVRSGDHIDIIAVDGNGNDSTAKVVLQHVLVTDVTVSPNSISTSAVSGQEGADTNPGPESSAVRGGIPSVYTVAVSPEDATKLALVRNFDVYVVLSANLPEETATAGSNSANLFSGAVGDSSAGTSNSIFIKRWDVAFTPGNVYVDGEGITWTVNQDKKWTSSKGTLAADDVPPGYLILPTGLTFTDAKGVVWTSQSNKDGSVWVSNSGQKLSLGDYPEGYDPSAQFNSTDKDAKN